MKRIILRIVLCLIAIVCLHYHSFAQANTAPTSARSDSEVLRDILNEIRQLRADILRLNVNAHRMQSLLDRTKVQQEQVIRLTREISNVGEELSAISVVDPKNWTVFDQQHTVQKGESTDGKTSKFPGANGFCGYNRKPPIEEAMRKFCNQFS